MTDVIAKRTWNPAYSYPDIGLWREEAWADKGSPITPLAQWIEARNYETVRHTTRTGRFDGRADGFYTAKTHSVTYPHIVDHWRSQGLVYLSDEMGQMNWIALLPEATATGTAGPRDLLLVLHDADYGDPDWAMETVEHYRAYNERAARDGHVLLYVVTDGVDASNMYIHMLQELAIKNHIDLRKVYLDLSALERERKDLADVPGFDAEGAVVERFANVPVLDITGRWHNRVSHLWENATAPRYDDPRFDRERMIHSSAGERMARGLALEQRFADGYDPELLALLESRGVRFTGHETEGQQWFSLVPLNALDEGATPLPVMLVFQEVTSLNPFQAVSALSAYHEYIDIVSGGELIVLFFALESPDDNDLGRQIVADAAELFPVDRTRLYVTGHSHNGHLAMEFARRHHDIVAAAASLGNAYGLPAPAYSHESIKLTDDKVELMSTFDLPVIDISGHPESDFLNNEVGTTGFANAVDSWQRRLRAIGAPQKTYDEIATAVTDGDYATRMVGVPNDHSEVQYRLGSECYIVDVLNSKGQQRLRVVALENFPHMPAPQMPGLSWDFVRRFARDLATGDIVELH